MALTEMFWEESHSHPVVENKRQWRKIAADVRSIYGCSNLPNRIIFDVVFSVVSRPEV